MQLESLFRHQKRRVPRTGQSALLLPPDQAVAAISATIVEELQPALERLEEFATLPNDWDSYGAAPISTVAVEHARELAAEIISKHALSIRPAGYSFDVVPTPDGGVQLEWDVGAHDLEISIGPHGTLAYLLVTTVDAERQTTSGEDVPRDLVIHIAEGLLRRRDA
jgi:hypothetical protein